MRHPGTEVLSEAFRRLGAKRDHGRCSKVVALMLLMASSLAAAQTAIDANGITTTLTAADNNTTYTSSTGDHTWWARQSLGAIDASGATGLKVVNSNPAAQYAVYAVRAESGAFINLGDGLKIEANATGISVRGNGTRVVGTNVDIVANKAVGDRFSAVNLEGFGEEVVIDGGTIVSDLHNAAWACSGPPGGADLHQGGLSSLTVKNATLTSGATANDVHAARVQGECTGAFENVTLNQLGTGTSASALFSQWGSTVTAKNVTAKTATGRGINANEAGKIELSGAIDVTALGPNAYGMRANQNGSYAGTKDKTTKISSDAASTIQIQTSGASGYGVLASGTSSAQPKATYDLQGRLDVTTAGASAHGIYLNGPYTTLTAAKLKSISAPGASANGVNVTGGSASLTGTGSAGEGTVTSGKATLLVSTGMNSSTPASLTGNKLTATSTAAEAARVEYDSEMTLTNTHLTGATHGVVLKGSSAKPDASFSLTGGSITAQSGDVIRIDAGVPTSVFTVELKNDVVVPQTGGNLLNVTVPGTVNFHADIAGTAIGDIVASGNNDIVNAKLSGSGWLIDAMHQSSPAKINLTIDAGSHWRMNDSSELNNVRNSGTIDLIEPNSPYTFDVLTVNDFEGVGAANRLVLNTRLGDDSSPTDLLHIEGAASGKTYIQIRPAAGSLGAATTGNGILIVKANNSSAISPSNFALAGSVIHNGYVYTLDFNVDGNVYLISQLGVGPVSGVPIPVNGTLALLLLAGALLGVAWRQRRA